MGRRGKLFVKRRVKISGSGEGGDPLRSLEAPWAREGNTQIIVDEGG